MDKAEVSPRSLLDIYNALYFQLLGDLQSNPADHRFQKAFNVFNHFTLFILHKNEEPRIKQDFDQQVPIYRELLNNLDVHIKSLLEAIAVAEQEKLVPQYPAGRHSAGGENACNPTPPGLSTNQIFVKNLHKDHSWRAIHKYFRQFGEVADIFIQENKSGESFGRAVVEFVNIADAQKVVVQKHHQIKDGDQQFAVACEFKTKEQLEALQANNTFYDLFLGGLPPNITESLLNTELSMHRIAVQTIDLRDGYAFLKLQRRSDKDSIVQKKYLWILNRNVEVKEFKKTLPPWSKSTRLIQNSS